MSPWTQRTTPSHRARPAPPPDRAGGRGVDAPARSPEARWVTSSYARRVPPRKKLCTPAGDRGRVLALQRGQEARHLEAEPRRVGHRSGGALTPSIQGRPTTGTGSRGRAGHARGTGTRTGRRGASTGGDPGSFSRLGVLRGGADGSHLLAQPEGLVVPAAEGHGPTGNRPTAGTGPRPGHAPGRRPRSRTGTGPRSGVSLTSTSSLSANSDASVHLTRA